MFKSDICIVGAGPAGLFAAISCARAGIDVLVVERNSNACRKLLLTGGGRCNFTHTGSIDDLIKAYGKSGRFLLHSMHEFSNKDLIKFFAERRIETRQENDGCIFPQTNRAGDIAQVLIEDAAKLSVRFLYGTKLIDINTIFKKPQSTGPQHVFTSPERKRRDLSAFVMHTGKNEIISRKLVIATGGASWPNTGSTGDGYCFAESLGHSVIKPKAALGPLLVAEKWPNRLAGVSVDDVIIKCKTEFVKAKTRGPLIFTQNGIGGPAVLDMSRYLTDFLPAHKNPIKINIDLLPDYTPEQLDKEIIKCCSAQPKKQIAGVLSGYLPKSLSVSLCEQAKVSTTQANQLQHGKRSELVNMIKGLRISVAAVCPIEQATVTRGGVVTNEINSRTMESKITPGLFFAGEVINADGPCGGYNLQMAFSTGHLAGTSAAKSILE